MNTVHVSSQQGNLSQLGPLPTGNNLSAPSSQWKTLSVKSIEWAQKS